MTRWKVLPWYPKPFSPVHKARKFSKTKFDGRGKRSMSHGYRLFSVRHHRRATRKTGKHRSKPREDSARTLNVIRPASLPSMVTSKNTFDLAICSRNELVEQFNLED